MDLVYNTLLISHIVSGGLSLLSGSLLMVGRKGTRFHTRTGLLYYYALLVSCLVALPMSYLHPNLFLAIISLITLYMLFSGKRYLKIKSASDFCWKDRWLLAALVVMGSVFAIWGGLLMVQAQFFGTVLLVIGTVSLNFARQDYLNMRGSTKYRNFGLVRHLQRMGGAFIASLTAFVVVNNTWLPGVLAWLLPSACTVPFIVYWSRRWGRLK